MTSYTVTLSLVLTLLVAGVSAGSTLAQERLGPSGGPGGGDFQIGCKRIRSILVRSGRRIDSIGLECEQKDDAIGATGGQAGGEGGSPGRFDLDLGKDERMVGIRGTFGNCDESTPRVCSFRFITNLRESEEFGQRGDADFSYRVPCGRITGFYGRSGKEIDAIGVVVSPSP